MTSEHKALVAAAKDLIESASDSYKARNGREISIEADDGEKCWIVHSDHIDALRAAIESLSAQSAQPQTCEPGKPAAFIQKEVLDALLKDKSATGTVSSGLLRKPFGNPVALYTSPQPANPAQVTDATDILRGKIGEIICLETGADENSKGLAQAVERILAAIGAGGQAVVVKPLEWTGRNKDGTIHIAHVVPMEYWAWELAGFGYWSWGTLSGREVHGGIEAAKAAAQADYERRILSALSQPHTTDERVVEARELARAAKAFLNNCWMGVVDGRLTHEENWKEFERRLPGAKWLHEALEAALAQEGRS